MNLAGLPRTVKGGAGFELVTEFLKSRRAASGTRLPLEDANIDAARGQQRGDRQPANASADNDNVIDHKGQMLDVRYPRGRQQRYSDISHPASAFKGLRARSSRRWRLSARRLGRALACRARRRCRAIEAR